jgi:hypothetical protein
MDRYSKPLSLISYLDVHPPTWTFGFTLEAIVLHISETRFLQVFGK